ncbi:B12-binding domain-containing protein [Streptomyces sp. NPDC088785]|uniref:cobalamin B12-binding domain-containing protein n=1 Tax=Streptomyces sp. NPDC088785 TaxID=3365897 RepID=UPI0038161C6B
MTSQSVVTDGPLSPDVLRERLWRAVIDCDDTHAVALTRRAMSGTEPARLPAVAERVLLELIAPVQRRVGEEWAANRLTVAQEHAATAISARCVTAVSDLAAPAVTGPPRGRLTVACVEGEWHALPARLVGEVLRLRGWRVEHLGAQVPTEHLVAHLHQRVATAVLLSCSTPAQLPAAHTAITACQAAGTPVLAGGAGFGPQGRHALRMGALWAADADAAHTLLSAGLDRPAASAARLATHDLPHLDDQEYTAVKRSKRQLVKQTFVDLEEAYPPMTGYSDIQRDRTAEDLDHIVTYLATALYVDDAELFTSFIAWTADILAARGVPAGGLVPALHSLARQLTDFPRARHILARARAILTVPRPGQPA